jgi:DNA polymerase
MGINNYTRRWERLYTYGGKLSADATQATARELFAYNWSHVEDLGFPIVLRVHDELVTEPLDDPNYSVTKLMKAMTRRPPWIDDKLPLAAGGFEAYRYRKDD